MSKANNPKNQQTNAAPPGMWLRWNGKEHIFGQGTVEGAPGTGVLFIHLQCDCGMEPALLGMSLETAKATANTMLKAVAAIEGGENLPAQSIPGVFHA